MHNNRGLLVHSIMSSFEPIFVSSQANTFIEMIKECDENYFPKVCNLNNSYERYISAS